MENLFEGRFSYLEFFYNLEKTLTPATYEHSKNVADLTMMLLDRFEEPCSKEEREEIYIGCLLHDIGKTLIPDSILNKESPLAEPERQMIYKHPSFGYELIKPYCNSEIILSIIKYHHEKLDGSGYPEGKIDIPGIVQVVTISDIFDALRSKRSYKQEFSYKESIEILECESMKNKLNKKIIEALKVISEG